MAKNKLKRFHIPLCFMAQIPPINLTAPALRLPQLKNPKSADAAIRVFADISPLQTADLGLFLCVLPYSV
jgi:hypothetical protein